MEFYLHSKNNAQEAPPVESLHDTDDDNNNKPLIPLRLPAALLATLSNESRLMIHHHRSRSRSSRSNAINADTTDGRLLGEYSCGEKRVVTVATTDALTLTVVPNGETDTHPDDCYPLEESIDPKQHTDWYQSQSTTTTTTNTTTNTASDNPNATTTPKKELYLVGTTNKQYTIIPKSTTTDLKEIGKRTRRLLEQERKKRKEIVRLDDDELPLPPRNPSKKKTTVRKKKTPPFTDATKMPPLKKTVTKPSSATTNARKRKRRGVPSNIDGWMPNIHDLLPSNNTADHRSNIVRLHGLPHGVKPEHVRKFFDGLNPSLIFVLPSFTNSIRGWDASSSSSSSYETTNYFTSPAVVKRHASNFRVFVKFASAPVADAAIERSGESIGLDIWKGEGESTNNNTATTGAVSSSIRGKEKEKKIVGASISLSPVSKHVASFLVTHMVSIISLTLNDTMQNTCHVCFSFY